MEKEEFDLSNKTTFLVYDEKHVLVSDIIYFIKIVEEIIKDQVSIPEKLRRLHKSAGDELNGR